MGQIQAEADVRSANCVEERNEPFRSAFKEGASAGTEWVKRV